MVRRLLEAMQDSSKIDDKDYYGNKRLECAGQLMSLLFEDKFKTFNSEIKKEFEKIFAKNKSSNLRSEIMLIVKRSSDIISKGCFLLITFFIILNIGILNTLSSGNWNLKRFKMERAGVTQVLNRLSFIQALGSMTKLNSQFEKTRKISGIYIFLNF